MKKTQIIYAFLYLCNLNALSQDVNISSRQLPTVRFETRTVLRGSDTSSFKPTPSDDSERIKHEYKIEKDSVFFVLKADQIENGVHKNSEAILEGTTRIIDLDAIVNKQKVYKGTEIFFEMIPDISDPTKMILFSFSPSFESYKYLICSDNKQIKYKKFEVVDPSKHNQIPLLLCYADDTQNQTEKLLEKYVKNNLISITSKEEIQEKIIKYIEKGMFVYYNLSDE